MTTTVFPGRYESLSAIRDFVVNVAKRAGFKDFDLYAVELAVDEACSNIIEHAYGGEDKGDIELTCDSTDRSLIIVLRDRGRPFDPTIIPEPNFGLNIDQLKPGGAGLFLMHKMMDEVYFDFSIGSGNVLTMIKNKKTELSN